MEGSDVRSKTGATEYKLSMSSNASSRRSSMAMGLADSENSLNEEASSNIFVETIMPKVREMADSVVTLDSNMTKMNFIHESLVDLNESLGALLYGVMVNSFCATFPNAPHNLDTDLVHLKRLADLRREKAELQRQLKELTTPKPKMMPKEQIKITHVSKTRDTERLRSVKPSMHAENNPQVVEPLVDEDDGSEASFVINPVNRSRAIAQANRVSKATTDEGNKFRRRSILHTIRNSIATVNDAHADSADSMNSNYKWLDDNVRRHTNSAIVSGRISLGGGAARVINRDRARNERSTDGQTRRTSSKPSERPLRFR